MPDSRFLEVSSLTCHSLPKTFTRPWTIAFPITRITRPGYENMELACVEGERDLKHYTEG